MAVDHFEPRDPACVRCLEAAGTIEAEDGLICTVCDASEKAAACEHPARALRDPYRADGTWFVRCTSCKKVLDLYEMLSRPIGDAAGGERVRGSMNANATKEAAA